MIGVLKDHLINLIQLEAQADFFLQEQAGTERHLLWIAQRLIVTLS